MSDSRGFVRLSITVPAELKDQMDSVKESVNWSAIAAEAFRKEVRKLTPVRKVKGKDMKEVIERLKNAQAEEGTEDFQDGKTAGEAWAKRRASAKQLRRLDEKNDDLPFGHGITDSFGWPGILFVTIHGKSFADRASLNEFWQLVLDENADRLFDEDFARGFVAGALEVWEAVEGQV